MPGPITRHDRIIPAIIAYTETTGRLVDETLYIDMVRDILSYARETRHDPREICEGATVTNDD